MSVLTFIAVLLLAAAVISFILSLLGVVIVGALKLLPAVLIVLAVLFFVRGGRVRLEFPSDRGADEDR